MSADENSRFHHQARVKRRLNVKLFFHIFLCPIKFSYLPLIDFSGIFYDKMSYCKEEGEALI